MKLFIAFVLMMIMAVQNAVAAATDSNRGPCTKPYFRFFYFSTHYFGFSCSPCIHFSVLVVRLFLLAYVGYLTLFFHPGGGIYDYLYRDSFWVGIDYLMDLLEKFSRLPIVFFAVFFSVLESCSVVDQFIFSCFRFFNMFAADLVIS